MYRKCHEKYRQTQQVYGQIAQKIAEEGQRVISFRRYVQRSENIIAYHILIRLAPDCHERFAVAYHDQRGGAAGGYSWMPSSSCMPPLSGQRDIAPCSRLERQIFPDRSPDSQHRPASVTRHDCSASGRFAISAVYCDW